MNQKLLDSYANKIIGQQYQFNYNGNKNTENGINILLANKAFNENDSPT